MALAASQVQTNLRGTTIEQILGAATNTIQSVGTTVKNSATGAIASIGGVSTAESGSYILKVIYYFIMFAFFIFLVALLIHFTYKPVFRFVPGGKGVVGVPGTSDDKVYWNDRKQPAQRSHVPPPKDELETYPFENNFSFSVDLYVRKLPETNVKNRLILAKAVKPNRISDTESTTPFDNGPTDSDQDLQTYMNGKSQLIMYLTNTNDLIVTLYNNNSSGQPVAYSSRPIYNIPLYTPFRITVVVEERIFTVYMNAKQVFQRIIPNTIASVGNQRFYSPPIWAENPTKTIFLQNFHLWPRVIYGSEIAQALPALAKAPDFDMPSEPGTGSCY